MSNEEIIKLSLLIGLNINSFLIGFLFGRIFKKSNENKQKSFFDINQNNTKDNSVQIDNKKVVLEIKTDNLEKKYNSLGDIKTSEENISESINKLKNIKK